MRPGQGVTPLRGRRSWSRNVARSGLLCVAALVFATVDAWAQGAGGEGAASPLWYGVTIGGAGTRLTCDLCQTSRDLGPAVTAAFGAHAGPGLRVGLEGGGWTHREGVVRERSYAAGLVAHLVPIPGRGLHLLGGFGWTGYRAGNFSYDAPRLTVGLGWDLPVVGSWVVGNLVALDASAFAPLKNGEVTVLRDVAMSSLRVAVQVRRN